MDFIFLVCHTKEETKIQEFSLPLNIEKIEKWSDLIDISLQKIIIESPFKLFEEKEFKVDTEQVPILKVEAGYSYFLTGSTNDQKKLDILKKITELSEIEASNLLEAFGSIEVRLISFNLECICQLFEKSKFNHDRKRFKRFRFIQSM